MIKVALFVRLEAKAGKEADLEKFLKPVCRWRTRRQPLPFGSRYG
jgi:hypothetical protein